MGNSEVPAKVSLRLAGSLFKKLSKRNWTQKKQSKISNTVCKYFLELNLFSVPSQSNSTSYFKIPVSAHGYQFFVHFATVCILVFLLNNFWLDVIFSHFCLLAHLTICSSNSVNPSTVLGFRKIRKFFLLLTMKRSVYVELFICKLFSQRKLEKITLFVLCFTARKSVVCLMFIISLWEKRKLFRTFVSRLCKLVCCFKTLIILSF